MLLGNVAAWMEGGGVGVDGWVGGWALAGCVHIQPLLPTQPPTAKTYMRNMHAHPSPPPPPYRVHWKSLRPMSLNPLRSKREMMSPTSPRCTPSGLIITSGERGGGVSW